MDASDWNARYNTAELIWKGEPNQFLPPEVADLPVGRAVDLACGEGRNAVWLATQGWDITGVDFSDVGIAKAGNLATEHGVSGAWVTADVTTWAPPADGFELIIERAGRIDRVVSTPDGDRTAIDTIVRARRVGSGAF